MIRLWIIAFALLIKAAFSKIQGDQFWAYDFFPYADIKMIWPEYLWHITFYVAFAALAWEFLLQEQKYKTEILIFAILMTGELVDFLLRCNRSWFQIGSYAFSYDSFIFIVFGAIVLRAHERV